MSLSELGILCSAFWGETERIEGRRPSGRSGVRKRVSAATRKYGRLNVYRHNII